MPPEACLTNINETDTLNFFIIQNATMEVLESYALKNNTKIQTRRLQSVLPELSHERTLVVDIDALPRHLWRCARWVTWRAAPRSSAGWIGRCAKAIERVFNSQRKWPTFCRIAGIAAWCILIIAPVAAAFVLTDVLPGSFAYPVHCV